MDVGRRPSRGGRLIIDLVVDLVEEDGGVGMGRPTKRTEANRTTILRALRLGATLRLAAESAGLSYPTLNEWMHDDPEFSEAVKKAEATMATNALRRIERAAKEGTWQAAAWIMERRFPHEYGRTVQEHTGEQALTITISKRASATGEAKSEAKSA